MEQALAHVEDSIARSEMISRWTAGVAACPAADRLTLQCRGADRALAVGEAEEAHQWARAAAALAPDDVAVTMLLGRSLVALGDLVAAEVTLRHVKRSDGVACDASVTALVNAELAEIAYMKGDMAAAAAAAAEALAQVPGPTARSEATSKARNTLGKILLAEAKWDDADRHFAEDAHAAASCGDTTAEFRARLNRGIAFLSKGALDGARALFEEVRSEAETVGNVRASVFALDNLAVVATWRHER
jgi:tetratricopeptide (TPR) repeat protein